MTHPGAKDSKSDFETHLKKIRAGPTTNLASEVAASIRVNIDELLNSIKAPGSPGSTSLTLLDPKSSRCPSKTGVKPVLAMHTTRGPSSPNLSVCVESEALGFVDFTKPDSMYKKLGSKIILKEHPDAYTNNVGTLVNGGGCTSPC